MVYTHSNTHTAAAATSTNTQQRTCWHTHTHTEAPAVFSQLSYHLLLTPRQNYFRHQHQHGGALQQLIYKLNSIDLRQEIRDVEKSNAMIIERKTAATFQDELC